MREAKAGLDVKQTVLQTSSLNNSATRAEKQVVDILVRVSRAEEVMQK